MSVPKYCFRSLLSPVLGHNMGGNWNHWGGLANQPKLRPPSAQAMKNELFGGTASAGFRHGRKWLSEALEEEYFTGTSTYYCICRLSIFKCRIGMCDNAGVASRSKHLFPDEWAGSCCLLEAACYAAKPLLHGMVVIMKDISLGYFLFPHDFPSPPHGLGV